jgi:hypothetical protein
LSYVEKSKIKNSHENENLPTIVVPQLLKRRLEIMLACGAFQSPNTPRISYDALH